MAGENGGRGVGGFVVFLAILGIVNLLSWLFDWPFWIF